MDCLPYICVCREKKFWGMVKHDKWQVEFYAARAC